MTQPAGGDAERRVYERVFEQARRYALRYVDGDQASDVAHDVAVRLLRRSAVPGRLPEGERPMNAFIHRCVLNRLRDGHRSRSVRAAAEETHAVERRDAAPAWANPADALEATELAAIMRGVIAQMPVAMRTVFLLVREHDRSYKEVAAELQIAVGTVHTQLSRANALLREAIGRYRAAADPRALRNSA